MKMVNPAGAACVAGSRPPVSRRLVCSSRSAPSCASQSACRGGRAKGVWVCCRSFGPQAQAARKSSAPDESERTLHALFGASSGNRDRRIQNGVWVGQSRPGTCRFNRAQHCGPRARRTRKLVPRPIAPPEYPMTLVIANGPPVVDPKKKRPSRDRPTDMPRSPLQVRRRRRRPARTQRIPKRRSAPVPQIRGVLGTTSIDHLAPHLPRHHPVARRSQHLGYGRMTNSTTDMRNTLKTIVVRGSTAAEAHSGFAQHNHDRQGYHRANVSS